MGTAKRILVSVLTLLLLAGSLVLTGCNEKDRASYDTVILSWGGISDRDDVDTWIGDEIADRMFRRTDGRVQIICYDNQQLGSSEQIFQEIQRGNVDMGLISVYEEGNPRATIVYLPFLTGDYDSFREVYGRGSDLFKYVDDSYKERNITLLGFWPKGYAGVGLTHAESDESAFFDPTTKNRETVRTPDVLVVDKSLRTMGFNTEVIDYNSIYRALRDGEVDGSFSSGTYENYMLYRDVLEYYIDYRMMADVYTCMISTDSFNKLTPEDQKLLIETTAEVIDEGIDKIEKKEEQALKDLAASGVKVLIPTEAQRNYMRQYYQAIVWPDLGTAFDSNLLNSLRGL